MLTNKLKSMNVVVALTTSAKIYHIYGFIYIFGQEDRNKDKFDKGKCLNNSLPSILVSPVVCCVSNFSLPNSSFSFSVDGFSDVISRSPYHNNCPLNEYDDRAISG